MVIQKPVARLFINFICDIIFCEHCSNSDVLLRTNRLILSLKYFSSRLKYDILTRLDNKSVNRI